MAQIARKNLDRPIATEFVSRREDETLKRRVDVTDGPRKGHFRIVGAIAHLLLQGAVMLAPALPFSTEPRQGGRASQMYGLMFFAAIAGGLMPIGLLMTHASRVATVLLVVVLAAATTGLERMVRARARAEVYALEV